MPTFIALDVAAEQTPYTADQIAEVFDNDRDAWVRDADNNVLGITPEALAWLQSGEADAAIF